MLLVSATTDIAELKRLTESVHVHIHTVAKVRYVLQVIPQLQGDATDQTPPDLPSYLFKERIVYLVRPYPTLSLC